jgi:hypothetical protein
MICCGFRDALRLDNGEVEHSQSGSKANQRRNHWQPAIRSAQRGEAIWDRGKL